MAYIEIEMKEETLKLEYDRDAIIKMEEMGYNAIDPTSKGVLTAIEIMVHGGLLKHQPHVNWKKVVEVTEFMKTEYGLGEVVNVLVPMVNDVFQMEGKGKKLVVKGTKTQA